MKLPYASSMPLNDVSKRDLLSEGLLVGTTIIILVLGVFASFEPNWVFASSNTGLTDAIILKPLHTLRKDKVQLRKAES